MPNLKFEERVTKIMAKMRQLFCGRIRWLKNFAGKSVLMATSI